jgi:hypothetical protein
LFGDSDGDDLFGNSGAHLELSFQSSGADDGNLDFLLDEAAGNAANFSFEFDNASNNGAGNDDFFLF